MHGLPPFASFLIEHWREILIVGTIVGGVLGAFVYKITVESWCH